MTFTSLYWLMQSYNFVPTKDVDGMTFFPTDVDVPTKDVDEMIFSPYNC